MNVVKQEGDQFTVEMSKRELSYLTAFIIDVDHASDFFHDGEDLGNLADHIDRFISEATQAAN